MSHCITIKEAHLSYSHFVSICDESEPDDIIRLIKNDKGEVCLSSNYSIADRAILFVSNIPWLCEFKYISNFRQEIDSQQHDAVIAFLETLNNGFGNTFSLNRLPEVKTGGYCLECKNITKYLYLASKVNPSSFTAKYCNQKNLISMKEGLTYSFPKIEREFYDCLLGKDDRILKKFHDEIHYQVNEILQTARVPQSVYDVIAARILEYININALENSYSLDALKCYLYTLSGSNKEKEILNQVPGNPFALKMNERLALLNLSMGDDSYALDNLLCDVFLLNEKIKLKSREDKNLLCSGMYAYLTKQFYDGLIKDSIANVNSEQMHAEQLEPLSVSVTPYRLQEWLSDTSSLNGFFSSVCSVDDNVEMISSADSNDFPPALTPKKLTRLQRNLSDIYDFPPLPPSEELTRLQGNLTDINDFPPPPPPPPPPQSEELTRLQGNLTDINDFPLPPPSEELTRLEGNLTDINDFPPPPPPEELTRLQGNLSDINDFPPPPTAEELRSYQDESSEPCEIDSLYGSASDESGSDNEVA